MEHQVEYRIEYLTIATNKIGELTLGLTSENVERWEELFTMACNTLNKLKDDEIFYSVLDKLAARRNEQPEAFNEITQLHHFVKNFLPSEKTLLQ